MEWSVSPGLDWKIASYKGGCKLQSRNCAKFKAICYLSEEALFRKGGLAVHCCLGLFA
jgi:hypothetical protein